MYGSSEYWEKIKAVAEQVAGSDAPILLIGETGTGKEQMAKHIHDLSNRKMFVSVSCSVPDTLIESDLFGHVQGAFTGAIKTTKGKMEFADNGTLLLDDVCDFSPNMQVKMLRVLQERTFTPVGSTDEKPLNARIISTSGKELRNSSFRQDFFYRISAVTIKIPPLRERMPEIDGIIQHCIHVTNARYKKNIVGITDSVRAFFHNYDFPGNIRELQQMVDGASLVCETERLHMEDIEKSTGWTEFVNTFKMDKLKDIEKEHILHVLAKYRGNRTQTAEALGICIRTLRIRLVEYRNDGSVFQDRIAI